jgi:hypothetical protein
MSHLPDFSRTVRSNTSRLSRDATEIPPPTRCAYRLKTHRSFLFVAADEHNLGTGTSQRLCHRAAQFAGATDNNRGFSLEREKFF